MEMPLGITIEKLVAKVRLAKDRTDNIKAFGELWLHEAEQSGPLFKVKGFTIKLIQLKSGKKVLTVDFPSYSSKRSKSGFQKSFITENKSLLEDIRQLLLEEFAQESGGLSTEEVIDIDENVEINLDELPI